MMNAHIGFGRVRARLARIVAAAALLAALVSISGCSSLLDVKNPNNVNETALDDPSAAGPMVNGVVAALTRGLTQAAGHHEAASDNIKWTGSLDGMNELNRGNVRDQYNEFIEDATRGMSTARWWANKTVQRLEAFRAAGQLTDQTLLARANLFDAITYIYIADMWNDFVIESDRMVAGAPVGPAKMVTLYDSAEAAVTRALPIAQAAGDAAMQGQLYAIRARARFDRAVWKKIHPSGTTPTDPLVKDDGAASDAQAAIAAFGSGDYRFKLEMPSSITYGNCHFAPCINSRQELAFNPAIATYDYKAKKLTVLLKDPIDGIADPVIALLVQEFVAGGNLAPFTITGTRDMLLILAENALANNDAPGFETYINRIRAFNALTPYSGQVPALELLKHERWVNLYLQARRLSDLYRFGMTSPFWVENSHAKACPGSLFPITLTERLANPLVTNPPACGE